MRRRRLLFLTAAAATLLSVFGVVSGAPGAAVAAGKYPPIKHVFVVMLENQGFNGAFETNPYPYLPALAGKGALLEQYYGVAHESLPNYIALLGGQTPTHETQADCPYYSDLENSTPGQAGWTGQDGGEGCVYLPDRRTIANQLDALHLTWKGYMEDLNFDPARDGSMTCTKPPAAGQQDPTQSAEAADQYAARHDPFMYYHAIIDLPECRTNVVTLQDRSRGLLHDLQSVATTPNFSFITPNLCNDGHDPSSTSPPPKQCAAPDVSGDSTGGLKAVDHWLSAYVPRILASPAYQQDGMLVIAFDEADTNPNDPSTYTSCCNEYAGPNTTSPGVQSDPSSGAVSGGGQVGAIVLSRYVKPGTITQKPYNHLALLRTLEELFGCGGGDDGAGHLGAAGDYKQRPGPAPFGADVFSNPSGILDSIALPSAPANPFLSGALPGARASTPGGSSTSALPPYPEAGVADSGNAGSAGAAQATSPVVREPFRPTGVAQAESSFPLGMSLLIVLLPLFAAGAAAFALGAGRR